MTEPSAVSTLSAREKILSAALELFAERGFDGVSLRELAERVGLHNSTLFHHFRSKADLARSVRDAVSERQLELISPLLGDDPPRLETLVSVLRSAAAHFQAAPNEARLLLRVLATPPGSAGDSDLPIDPAHPLARIAAGLDHWLERARVAGAIRSVDPSETRRALLALLLFQADGPQPEASEQNALDGNARLGELTRFAAAALAP